MPTASQGNFFFSSRRRHTRSKRDWSSDVCSSDLDQELARTFPIGLLRLVGYWGRPEGAREAFLQLASGLDLAVVRPVPARRNDLAVVRLAMQACAPRS